MSIRTFRDGTPVPMIDMWEGDDGIKRIDDMTRDELIGVIREIGRELSYYRAPGMSRAIGLGKAEMLRRGLDARL